MSIRQARIATRLLAGCVALVLIGSSCGSGDDEVVTQADPTAVVDADTAQPGDDESTVEPTTPAPTTEPTAPAPTSEPTPAPTPTGAPTATPEPSPTTKPIPIELPSLVGQDWYVQSIDSVVANLAPRPIGAVARVQFSQDGTVSGNAACNDFSADYTIGESGELSITNFVISDMNCFIPDWAAFVEMFPGVTGFGSAGGPDPILFVGSTGSIALGSTPPAPNPAVTPQADYAIADYIGLSEIEAAQLADSRGVAFRVSSIDGEPLALTLDFVEDRVNADVVDGIVVNATLG